MKYPHNTGIILTKLERSEISILKKLKDESWFGTHSFSIVNLEDQEKWFDSIQNSKTYLCLKAYLDDSIIGIFKIDSIDSVNRSCNVGWDVLDEYRGKGYGKKLVSAGVDFCFEILNMHRLNAEILENNKASQKCADYSGWLCEGVKKQAIFKCGEYISSRIYGILYDDWKKNKTERFKSEFCNTGYLPKERK